MFRNFLTLELCTYILLMSLIVEIGRRRGITVGGFLFITSYTCLSVIFKISGTLKITKTRLIATIKTCTHEINRPQIFPGPSVFPRKEPGIHLSREVHSTNILAEFSRNMFVKWFVSVLKCWRCIV